jgi:hypothetical protein
MSEGYGRKVAKAFEAVYQLHMDASKLLSDCDSTVGKGKESVFGSYVMKDLSKAVHQPDGWMPYGVYRYYDASDECPGLVDGVMLYFWDYPPLPEEPMLIAGRLKYRLDGEGGVKSVCNGWDLWWAAFDWSKDGPRAQVIALEDVGDGRVEWMKMIVVPLYSIKSMQEVERLMELVRQTAA